MTTINRRNFLKLGSGIIVGSAMAGCAGISTGGATKKVVVVGGGTGCATTAKYLRMLDAFIHLTLTDSNNHNHTR